MRVLCSECGDKSRIQKTNRISIEYTDLYCSCSNPECGHSFVMNLSFSHTLSPSAKSSGKLAFEILKSLDPSLQKELKQKLSML